MSEGTAHRAGPGAAPRESFRNGLAAFREGIEEALSAFLAERRGALGPEAAELVRAVEELVLGGGKRLRPALVHFTYRGCGGRDEAAVLPLAMSTELLHAYLLVHDDIMDHAERRRGGPTVHARFAGRHRERAWPGVAADYGVAMAILVGDLAHGWAVDLFAAARRAAGGGADVAALEAAFSATCQEVIVGQFLEMHLPLEGDPGEEDLLRVLRLKSGRYSVERPIQLGALLAGAPRAVRGELASYGRAVGEAFQLQDDILGVFAEPGTVGKPVGSDLAEGKRTLLVHHALRRAPPEAAGRLRALLGRADGGPEAVDEARRIIRDSGALDAVRAAIDERLGRAGRALEALDGLALGAEARSFFEGLIAYSRERDR